MIEGDSCHQDLKAGLVKLNRGRRAKSEFKTLTKRQKSRVDGRKSW